MTEYALVINGTFSRFGSYDARPPDAVHKGMRWYPVARDPVPAVTETQRAEPVGALVGDTWQITWNIVDITAEVNARKDAQAASQADQALAEVMRRILNGLYATVNNVRAAQSQAPLTKAQFLSFLDGTGGNEPVTKQELVTYLRGKM